MLVMRAVREIEAKDGDTRVAQAAQDARAREAGPIVATIFVRRGAESMLVYVGRADGIGQARYDSGATRIDFFGLIKHATFHAAGHWQNLSGHVTRQSIRGQEDCRHGNVARPGDLA
jgi:hypothetical protein